MNKQPALEKIEDDGSFGLAESFEAGEVPANWQTRAGGELALSGAHYKHGRQSLRWQWSGRSQLVAVEPTHLAAAGRARNGGIRFWIYSEAELPGKLVFHFGSKREMERGEPRYQVEIGVGFTGWRGLNVHFREDGVAEGRGGDPGDASKSASSKSANEAVAAKASSDEPLEVMEIVSPAEAPSGVLFFDIIEFVEHIPASRSSDFQLPFLRQSANGGKGGSWDRSFYFSRLAPTLPLPEAISNEQIRAFETISARLDRWVFGDRPDLTQEPLRIRNEALQTFIRNGVERYVALHIRRDAEGNITGLPLFSSRSTHGPEFGQTISRRIFLPIVFDYKLNGNEDSKRKALDLFDYFHDQGWAAGSGLETLDHETNRNNGYFFAVFLMRRELAATGRLAREQAAVHWFLNIGKTYGAPEIDYQETTSDEVRTRFIYKLMYVLAMEDGPDKVRHMQGLVQWMDHALKIAPGYSGTVKHDYMGFHHRGVYMSAYAPNAYHTAALMIWLLHGTPFALSAESVNNVGQALLTLCTVTNKYDVPVGIAGRFPTKGGITNEVLPAYAYMALADPPAHLNMAGAFMRLWDPGSPYLREKLFPEASSDGVQYIDTLGGVQLMLELAAQGHPAEASPQGFWVKPSAAMAVLRRDEWMVSTKCYSQYVFDFEAHGRRNTESVHKFTEGENVYGRYISYGAMQILACGDPVNSEASGYALDRGWDWRRWPGATTKRVPLTDMLVGKNGSGSGMFNENTRNFSDETFVGGVTSEGRDGVFAMKLHDTVFDPSFRANKSWFYFGNEIIALGSDIVNEDWQHATETTLFQAHLPDPALPIAIDSEPVSAMPYTYKPSSEPTGAADANTHAQDQPAAPVSLTDPYGNSYIVPDPRSLRIERSLRQSIAHTGSTPTSGHYSTAWLAHGTSPQAAAYEYAVLVQTPPEQAAAYALAMPYRVVRKDACAHIVEHTAAQAIGYVLFDERAEPDCGVLRRTSAPIVAMEKRQGDRLVLSVADPDLRLPKRPDQRMDDATAWTQGKSALVAIELAGHWAWRDSGAKPHNAELAAAQDGNTRIEIICINGDTTEMDLILDAPQG
jgi:hypothetical protein